VAAHYGVNIAVAADGPYVISGNDFDAATIAPIGASGGYVNAQSIKGNSDMHPTIPVASLGGGTSLNALAAGLAKEVIFVLSGITGTINSISASFLGQRVLIYNATNNAVTFSRTNAKLAGGAVAQLTQYSTLYLYCYSISGGPQFAEISRSTSNS
jgi:hypothetical protein